MYQDDATGQLGVLVVSSGDQAVWHRRQTGREPDKWSDWESLGQPDGDPVQGPVATATLSDGQVMAHGHPKGTSGSAWFRISNNHVTQLTGIR